MARTSGMCFFAVLSSIAFMSSTIANSANVDRHAKDVDVAKADVLTQEIGELEAFVQICKERIEMLEDLNRTVRSGIDLSLPESHIRMLQDQLPLMSALSTVSPDAAPTSSAEDYLTSKAIVLQENPVSFIRFLPLKNPRTSPGSTVTTLLVAVQSDGSVRLYNLSGDLVLAFSAGHSQPVTELAVAGSFADDHLIASADAEGMIRVHRVSVRQQTPQKEARKPRKQTEEDFEEKVSKFLVSQVNVTFQFTSQMRIPPRSDGEPARITALVMATPRGLKYFVAGDEEGRLTIFSQNGTAVTTLDASHSPGSPVQALFTSEDRQNAKVFFHVGYEWGAVNLEKLEVQHVECPEFDGRVVSAVIDSQLPSRAVVSDDEGSILVFDIKKRKGCKVEHTFRKGSSLAPITLASIRGFIIGVEHAEAGGDTSALMAFNMSHVGQTKDDLAASPSSVVWRFERPAIRDWAVKKGFEGSPGNLLAVLSKDGRQIEIFELLMQVYQPPVAVDMWSNLKLPIIIGGIILTLAYQYLKQRGTFGGGSSSKFDSPDPAPAKGKKKRQ